MKTRILMPAAAIVLTMLSAPAFAQASATDSMGGMNMGSMSNQSAPATDANKTDRAPSSENGAKKPMSMKGMDMREDTMSASNGKHGCMMMHMNKTAMSAMGNGNHHCMMRGKRATRRM